MGESGPMNDMGVARGDSNRMGHSDPLELLGAGNPPSAARDFCREFPIRIARDGTWYYHGTPIGRKPMVKLFASVLARVGDEFWLVTPVERGRITVDDAPFVAVAVDAEGAGEDLRLTFRTNIDEIVIAGPDHPIRVATNERGEPAPYLRVRDGLEALIGRAVFYELVERAVEREGMLGVWSNGAFFALGRP